MSYQPPKSTVLMLSLLTMVAVAVNGVAQPSEESDRDAWAESMMEEFTVVGRVVEGSSEQDKPAVFEQSANGPDPTTGVEVTRSRNPLMREECRKEALLVGVDRMKELKGMTEEQARGMANQHLHDRRELIRNGKVSYPAYLRHIGECKAFCGPVVAHMIHCHVAAVASHEHTLVLFDFDRAEVRPDQREAVTTMARRLDQSATGKILLIGRASRIGDLRYNRVLSGRRALAVKDELLASGVPEEDIETLWFGYEPPHIDQDVAESYGLRDLFAREGLNNVNQSVMLVLYEGQGG